MCQVHWVALGSTGTLAHAACRPSASMASTATDAGVYTPGRIQDARLADAGLSAGSPCRMLHAAAAGAHAA